MTPSDSRQNLTQEAHYGPRSERREKVFREKSRFFSIGCNTPALARYLFTLGLKLNVNIWEDPKFRNSRIWLKWTPRRQNFSIELYLTSFPEPAYLNDVMSNLTLYLLPKDVLRHNVIFF